MRILYIEPFETGSHAHFGRILSKGAWASWSAVTLPGRHWQWRMRGSAAHIACEERDRLHGKHDLLLASSFLPLAELVGLVPHLASTPRVLYFHENQLAYPVLERRERDMHYGFTQMISALAATHCVFNSAYNLESFVTEGEALLERMPDCRLEGWASRLRERSSVLPVPLEIGRCADFDELPRDARSEGPLILWNHRWEHDKNPEDFFEALFELQRRDVPFRVAVCGQRFGREPEIFARAKVALNPRIDHWGHLEDRADYLGLLSRAQLVVSTARQEFQGLSVLEAVGHGACPLVPDRLAYREIYPASDRYESPRDLFEMLEGRCRRWVAGDIDLRGDRLELVSPFTSARVLPRFEKLFDELVRGHGSAS